MKPVRLPDGRIRLPMRAEAPDGAIGDGVIIVGPGDPGFAEADAWLRDPPTEDEELREQLSWLPEPRPTVEEWRRTHP